MVTSDQPQQQSLAAVDGNVRPTHEKMSNIADETLDALIQQDIDINDVLAVYIFKTTLVDYYNITIIQLFGATVWLAYYFHNSIIANILRMEKQVGTDVSVFCKQGKQKERN